MHPLLHLLHSLPLILYYILEGIVLSLVPRRFRYKDIAGQTVLITGAGSGIGRQLAVQLSKLGTRLLLLDLDAEGLRKTESMLDRSCRGVFAYQCDVSDREAVYRVAAKIREDEAGPVDILVNNAGVVTGKRFLECPDEKITKTFEVNAMAHFWTCKAFLPDMLSANSGHLVFVASVAGFGGGPRLTDYCSSKFAVVGFEETLRLELQNEGLDGVKTTLVCPYLVTTGLFEGFDVPLLKPLTPEYVASEIVSAVLAEQELLIIPSYLRILIILKTLLPRTATRVVYEKTGFIKCMDNFQGRVPPQNGELKDER